MPVHRFRLLALVMLIATASFTTAAAEPGVSWYRNVRVAASDKTLCLFVRRVGDPQEPCVCLLRTPEGTWRLLAEFRADYRAATGTGDRFYLFLTESVIELDAATCRKTGETSWWFNWRPQTAVVVGGVLTAFGVNRKGVLYAARARMWTKSDAAATSAPAGTSQPARTTLSAGVRRPAGFLAEQWRLAEVPVKGQGRCRRVRAVVAAGRVWLFWSTEREGSGERLWAAVLGEAGPENTSLIATLNGGPVGFAAVAFHDQPMILFAVVPGRLGPDEGNWLRYHRFENGGWSRSHVVDGMTNPSGEETTALDAVVFDGRVHLFVETRLPFLAAARVLTTTFDGREWSPPAKVLSHPAADFVIENQPLILAGVVAAAGVFLVSLVRSRRLPHRAVIAGVEYVLAPWGLRAGAYACDLFIVAGAVWAMHLLAAQPLTQGSLVISVLVFELVYFSACEARSGKTIGKRVFGLIVVSRNGGYPNWSEAILRNLSRAVTDALAFFPWNWLVGSVVLLNSRGSQRVGDFAAGTYVVRERNAR